jgi:CheY-like chemotaxis protein
VKTILLVDDDAFALQSLADCLGVYRPRLALRSALGAEKASAVLAGERVDVLVTRLVMAGMDGFELIDFALREHPALVVVVVEDPSWGRLSQALGREDAFRYLPRPVRPQALVDAVLDGLDAETSGRLSGLSLTGVLQLLVEEGRSCGVHVRGGQGEGRLDLESGKLMHAVCGELQGKEALFELLRWPAPALELVTLEPPLSRSLWQGLQGLLLEAAALEDELLSGLGSTGRRSEESREAAFREALRLLVETSPGGGAALLDVASRSCLTALADDEHAFAREAESEVRAYLVSLPAGTLETVRQFQSRGGELHRLLRVVGAARDLLLYYRGPSLPTGLRAALDRAEASLRSR